MLGNRFAMSQAATTTRWCADHDGDGDSIANKCQRQPRNDEGCQKNRQEPLPGASEGDDLALGGVERLRTARLSAVADLQGMTSRLDRYLDRVVHFDRPDAPTVDTDIVCATTYFRSDCFHASISALPTSVDLPCSRTAVV
jgi:hypothetical protein